MRRVVIHGLAFLFGLCVLGPAIWPIPTTDKPSTILGRPAEPLQLRAGLRADTGGRRPAGAVLPKLETDSDLVRRWCAMSRVAGADLALAVERADLGAYKVAPRFLRFARDYPNAKWSRVAAVVREQDTCTLVAWNGDTLTVSGSSGTWSFKAQESAGVSGDFMPRWFAEVPKRW